jgi:hypothetical protein
LRLLAVLVLAALPASAFADDLALHKGDKVTILRTDGTTERAQFVSRVDDPPRLRLAAPDARHWGGGSWNAEVPVDQVARIEGPGERDFKERRLLVGTLVGMVAGGVLGLALGNHEDYGTYATVGWEDPQGRSNEWVEDTTAGMASGALFGLLGGLLTAPSTGPVRQWTFDAEGRAVQVPSR